MDPFDDHMIAFDGDKVNHSPLPSFVSFHIPILIKSTIVQ